MSLLKNFILVEDGYKDPSFPESVQSHRPLFVHWVTCAESSAMCFQHKSNKNELCVLDDSPYNFSVYAYWSGKEPNKQHTLKTLAKNTASIENSFNVQFHNYSVIKIILFSLNLVGSKTGKTTFCRIIIGQALKYYIMSHRTLV